MEVSTPPALNVRFDKSFTVSLLVLPSSNTSTSSMTLLHIAGAETSARLSVDSGRLSVSVRDKPLVTAAEVRACVLFDPPPLFLFFFDHSALPACLPSPAPSPRHCPPRSGHTSCCVSLSHSNNSPCFQTTRYACVRVRVLFFQSWPAR